MFSPEKFRSHFSKHQDFAKVSKFEVRIAAPKGAPDLTSLAPDLRFQCEAAELPGYSINTVDNRIYGVPNPVAATASFADITLTFICAGDLWEKRFFDRWMDLIVPINNYNPKYKDDYASPQITINQYSEIVEETTNGENTSLAEPTLTNNLRYSAILYGAFPVNMAPISLNWADDGFLRLPITFKFEYWTQAKAGPTAGSDKIERQEAQPNGSQSQNYVQDRTKLKSPANLFIGGGGKFGGGGASGSW